MNRNCEVKLVDVLKGRRNTRTNTENVTKSSKTPQLQTNKKELICQNKRALQNKELKYKNSKEYLGNVEEKATRSSKWLIKDSLPVHDSQNRKLNRNTNVVSELNKLLENPKHKTVDKVLQSILPQKATSRKRKSSESDENVTLNKKCNTKYFTSTFTVPKQTSTSTNEASEKIKQQKRTNRKGKLQFWESKLTGAKRVSKRLRNMKIKNDVMKGVEVQIEHCHLTKKKKEKVKHKIEKKRKATNIKHHKYRESIEPESSKSALYKAPQKEQTNYGKLNYTKKFHPRVNAFKVTSKIHSENLKSGVNEQLKLHDLNTDTVNELSSKAENITTNKVTVAQNIPDTTLFTEKDGGSEIESANESEEQHIGTTNQQDIDIVTYNKGQLNEGSNVILLQTDEAEISHNCLENTDEKNEQPVYDEQQDCFNCSEVIIIDIKSDENALSEHIEECELFSANLEHHDLKEESIGTLERKITPPEENAGVKPLDELGSSKSSVSSNNTCQVTESKIENVETAISDGSNSNKSDKKVTQDNSSIENLHGSTSVCEFIGTLDEVSAKYTEI